MSRARNFADLASAYSQDALSNRNMVINGNMAISQRKGTTAYTTINSYILDRYKLEHSGLDNLAFEVTQSTTVPDAFHGGYSLKYQTKTVESAIAADEFLQLVQFFEGQNLQKLCFGTSSAKTMTLSFWVRSSLTGTFGVSVYQYDGDDIIGGTYTINTADTWEYKTMSFVGNTGDAIANDNTQGFKVQWCLGLGSNFTGTANSTWSTYAAAKRWNGHTQSALLTTDESTWYITGIQLECGEVATEFEHEAYGDTLRKCQRYWQQSYAHGTAAGTATTTGRVIRFTDATQSYAGHWITFREEMRTAPSGTVYNTSTGGSASIRDDDGNHTGVAGHASTHGMHCYVNNSSVGGSETLSVQYTADAEL